MLLEVLQQRAAGGMNDALGDAGGAGGKQDVERVRKRQRLEGDRLRRVAGDEIRKRGGAFHGTGDSRTSSSIGTITVALGLSAAAISVSLAVTVLALAIVPVAVARDEQFRLDLAEAVEHALDAEIG
jgi:hypothetical protein